MDSQVTRKLKFLIIYHFEDNDGVCSAAIIYKHLCELYINEDIDTTLLPANYAILADIYKNNFNTIINDKLVNIINDFDSVYMTDISFNDFNAMIELYEQYTNNFIWIDHHYPIIKESIEKGYDKIKGLRTHKHSAIYNAYQYFNEGKDIPIILRYLSAWDSFTFDDEGLDFEKTRRINVGFTKMFELNINKWLDSLMFIMGPYNYGNYLNKAYEIGNEECNKQDERYKTIIDSFGMSGWSVNGRPAMCIITTERSSSLMFKSVQDKYLNGICIKSSNTGNIIVSVYNTNRTDHSFHCGEYLKQKYNGGGHEGAAGCTLTLEQFAECCKTKSI